MPSCVRAALTRRNLVRGSLLAVPAGIALAAATLAPQPAGASETYGATGPAVIARDPDGSGTAADLWLRDTKGDERKITDGTGRFRSAVWSPDGHRIAYVKQSFGGGAGDIWVVGSDGQDAVQMTSGAADDEDPDWSPDGTSLAFSSDRTGSRQVYTLGVGPQGPTGSPRQLTPAGGFMGATTESLDPAWAPDGTQLAVTNRHPGDPAQIWLVSASGSSSQPLTNTPGDHRDPAWSPDGDSIAFSSNRGAVGTNNYDVYVRPADPSVSDSAAHAVTSGPDFEGFPRWLPRVSGSFARRIAYSRTLAQNDDELRVVNDDGTSDHLYLSTAADDFEVDFQTLPDCTMTWTGGAGTNAWNTGLNWSTGVVPTGADAVCIPDMINPVTVTIPGGVAAAAKSLSSAENVELAGGTLNPGAGVTLRNGAQLLLTSGTLTGAGTLAGGTVTWHTSARLGDYQPNDAGTWTVASDATLALPDDATYYLRGTRVLDVRGTLSLTQTDNLSYFGGGELPRLVATGTVRKQDDTNVTTIDVPFDNDGTLEVASGKVVLRAPAVPALDGVSDAVDDGTFVAAAGTSVEFPSGQLTLGKPQTQLTGAGSYRLNGGTLDVGSKGLHTANTFVLDSGTLRGSGPLSGGTFEWHTSARLGDYQPNDTGTWTVASDATLALPDDATYYLRGNRVLDVQGTLLLTQTDNLTGFGGESAHLTNAGTIRKTADPSSTSIGLPLDNQGTVAVEAGSLTVPSTGATLTGGYGVADGATLRFSGNPAVTRNDGDLTVQGTGVVSDDSGRPLLRALATNTGTLTLTGAAALTTSADLVNTGTVRLRDTAALAAASYAQSAGTTDLHDAGTSLTASTATFTGGALRGNGTIHGNVTNDGGVVAPGNSPGTLTVDGSYTQTAAGTLQVEINGAAAADHDRLNVTGSASVAGVVDVRTGPGYTPDPASAFTVVSAPAVTMTATVQADGVEYQLKPDPSGNYVLTPKDTTPPTQPTVTASVPANRWTKSSTVSLTVSGSTDDGSGLAGYTVTWRKGAVTVATQSGVGPSFVSPALPSGQYTAEVVATDHDANAGQPVTVGPFWLDTTVPTASALTAPAAPVTLTVVRGKPVITVAWAAAADAGSGLAGYQVQTSTLSAGALSWSSWATGASTTARSTTVTAAAGRSYCFRVVSRDAVGNTSTGPRRCTSIPVDSTALAAKGAWSKTAMAKAYLGSVARTTASGATLTSASLSAEQVAIVVTKCSGCGKVTVYWAGKAVGTFDLSARSTTYQSVIVVKKLPRVAKGTIVIKAATSRKPIYVDAVVAIADN